MTAQPLREKILATIIEKSMLKQRVFDNTFAVFNLLKDTLFEMASEMEDALEGKNSRYLAEIRIYANNRTGILVDISKILTERQIDVITLNSRANKQGKATISISFEISSKDELNHIIEKLRNVESVIDIERTSG